MAAFKCKMCGGDLLIDAGMSVCECEYCGTKQTVPSADNEKKMTLFARAGRLLRGCEFDKAAGLFESIVAEFPTEAEAYWGLVLCHYGIEYVDDPATGKKVPTCHRSSFDSVLDDQNYEQACENADSIAHRVYRDEARAIEELRKGIIEVSGKEEPYDIFISYKETDDHGERTLDSVLAQEIYKELTNEGYRVFFSRITLEDKLGTEYEPYIFAALNSAKVMLVVGTDYDHFNAVWVKNEWSRFLKLIAAGQKKTLIPCYKNMDAYDMPKEFAKLTAQDMGKIGAMQDLLRGVGKIVPKEVKTPPAQSAGIASASALVMRGQFALDDGDFEMAGKYFERALDQNPRDGEAYLGKVMVALRVQSMHEINNCVVDLSEMKDFLRALQFVDSNKRTVLESILEHAKRKNEIAKLISVLKKRNQSLVDHRNYEINCETQYQEAVLTMSQATSKDDYQKAAQQFQKLLGWKDSDYRLKKCLESAECVATVLTQKRELTKKLNGVIACGKTHIVGLCADGSVVAAGGNEYGQCNVSEWRDIIALSCEDDLTVGLRSDGTVLAAGKGAEALLDWKDIKEICSGRVHTVGLRKDGSVVAAGEGLVRSPSYSDSEFLYKGDEESNRCAVGSWRRIVSIACSLNHTLGLREDGLVMATEYYHHDSPALRGTRRLKVDNWERVVGISSYRGSDEMYAGLCEDGTMVVPMWKTENFHDIVDIVCGCDFSVGLRSDGTVAMTYSQKLEKYSVKKAEKWHDIVSVVCGYRHIVGLRSNGTVVAVGDNEYGQCNVQDWEDVVYITCNGWNTVGLRSDGTMVAAGKHAVQWNSKGWNDIVAISCEEDTTVGLRNDGTVVAVGKGFENCSLQEQQNLQNWKDIISVKCGKYGNSNDSIIGRRKDGTVIAVGKYTKTDKKDIEEWTDIISVVGSDKHVIGLCKDGTVVAVGDNEYGQCNVQDWEDITAIGCSSRHTVGLRRDGTVVAVGENQYGQCDVQGWSDVVSINCSSAYTLGLKKDGTVVGTGNNHRDLSFLKNVVSVTGSGWRLLALCKDGTAVAAGDNKHGQCNVQRWTNIVSIVSSGAHHVGLRKDGTVVAVGYNEHGQCNVQDWEDIVEIDCGSWHTVGLRRDGTVVAVGKNFYGQCDTLLGFGKLFNDVDNLEDERKIAREALRKKDEEIRRNEELLLEMQRRKAEEARLARIAELNEKKSKLQIELKNLKGLFTGSKRRALEAEISKIDAELKKVVE